MEEDGKGKQKQQRGVPEDAIDVGEKWRERERNKIFQNLRVIEMERESRSIGSA